MKKIVRVLWTDSQGHGGWMDVSEAKKDLPLVVESVGYLITDTDDHVTIVQSITDEEDRVADSITIPRICIHSVDVLYLAS
jgi:hypothetical protein